MNNPQTFTIVQNQTLEATGRNKTKQICECEQHCEKKAKLIRTS